MGKLSQEHLKYLSEHMTGCRMRSGLNVNAKRRVLIQADSDAAGKEIAKILQSLYPETKIMDYSGGYKDFSLQFEYVWQRDQAVTDINKMVADYRLGHPETINTSEGYSDPESETTSSSRSNGTVTYIIIGAVAIVLLLLLWEKKKK